MIEFESRQLLRVYMGEQAKYHHRPLYEAVVDEAKERGVAGATVFKGILSYGMSGTLYTTKILELSQNLPVVIEIMDTRQQIEKFLPVIEAFASESGTHVYVTLEEIRAAVILPEE
ncbi:DUF190 domain-containing protein [Prosthecochloris sp.]|uniref:DUF190 domain-containing protein n=1 Tax=Prosthecochloris sp. TaxID=290513 RepID=UPI0025E95CC2|nr:DUF190 domain-containing protein [Prosthecochloris sp.]